MGVYRSSRVCVVVATLPYACKEREISIDILEYIEWRDRRRSQKYMKRKKQKARARAWMCALRYS